MRIYGTTGNDILRDNGRRDKLYGGDGADVFTMGRDGKRDFVMDFQDGIDLVDLTSFNVTFDELFIHQISAYRFVVKIRGEKTEINFQPPASGGPVSLTAVDFILAPGAAAPGVNLIADTIGANKLIGTGRPDVFLFNPDGSRDAIRQFELGKDKIDITTFDTSFANLDIQTIRPGRVIIHFVGETLVINDLSKQFIASDFTVEDFIFA